MRPVLEKEIKVKSMVDRELRAFSTTMNVEGISSSELNQSLVQIKAQMSQYGDKSDVVKDI